MSSPPAGRPTRLAGSLLALAALGGALATTVQSVHAQGPTFSRHGADSTAPAHTAGRWTAGYQFLHVGAAPIRRDAARSMSVTLGFALGRTADAPHAPRLEAGWLRASRPLTQVQGVTLGGSVGLPATRELTLRPGVAVLTGWAEAQAGGTTYGWQGLPGTPYAGQTGTQPVWYPVRGRTSGASLALHADLALTPALAVTGAVQQWAFTGPVIRPNRHATLAGVGVALRPRALAREAHALWYGPSAAARPGRPTVPQAASADSSADRAAAGATREGAR